MTVTFQGAVKALALMMYVAATVGVTSLWFVLDVEGETIPALAFFQTLLCTPVLFFLGECVHDLWWDNPSITIGRKKPQLPKAQGKR